jgi:hypothetical protein
MRLTLCVVFGATGKIMHCAIYFNRHTRTADGEVDRVAADLVLTNNVNAFAPQAPQRLPCADFARTHAAASFGCFSAR